MRFENIKLESLDTDMGNGEHEGNFIVPATNELVEVTNKIRNRQGHTDLVGVEYANDVYYTHYLYFNVDKKEITLQASVANGAKDDYVWYNIELLPEEKEMLIWKVVKELLSEIC